MRRRGEVGYYPVVAIWAHEDPVIVTLTIEGETIETTPEHPFYTVEGEWLPAASLQAGDEIRTSDWGTGTVEAIQFSHQPQLMYNFTVATAHTYFVGQGEWLVHNHCGERHSALLRESIMTYLGIDSLPSGVAAHHIIPDQFATHPLVQLASQVGWNNDTFYNGILLPTNMHQFHPEYNKYVQGLLDALWEIGQKEGWDSFNAFDNLWGLRTYFRRSYSKYASRFPDSLK